MHRNRSFFTASRKVAPRVLSQVRHVFQRVQRLVRELPVLLLGVVLLFGVAVVRLFRDVRIAWVTPERIGHFSSDVAFRYAMEQKDPPSARTIHCLLPREPVSNAFWLTMFERNLTVRDWPRPICRVARRLRRLPSWLIPPARVTNGSRDKDGLLQRAPKRMEFTAAEDDRAHAWLSSLGWIPGQPFVCLLVRDSAFLDSEPGLSHKDWRYHDYRNSSIENFVPAAEWLADQGVWVLRMGKTMAKRLVTEHERVIDYAFRADRSDFLDVWLFANCDLCISTGTGPDMISDVFRRPLLAVNYLPAMGLWSWSNAVTAPKPLVWSDTGRRLSIEELAHANWVYTEQYANHGIEIRDLDAGTIQGIVQEAWSRLKGDWIDTPLDARRNRAAWQALESHPEYANWHGYRHPSARFSSVWLRQLEAELATDTQPEHE